MEGSRRQHFGRLVSHAGESTRSWIRGHLQGSLVGACMAGVSGVLFALTTSAANEPAAFQALRSAAYAALADVGAVVLVMLVQLALAPGQVAREDCEQRLTKQAAAMTALAADRSVTFGMTPGMVEGVFEPGRFDGVTSALAYLSIKSTGRVDATNCRGHLISITNLATKRRSALNIPLAWDAAPPGGDRSRMSFHGTMRLNVARTLAGTLMRPTSAHELSAVEKRETQLDRDVDYLVEIEVSADNGPATVGRFRLGWSLAPGKVVKGRPRGPEQPRARFVPVAG